VPRFGGAFSYGAARSAGARHSMPFMSDPSLTLRRAMLARIGGNWHHEDYDVFDGDREIGRIYMVDGHDGNLVLSYGYAASLEAAKAAFRAEYLTARYSSQ
jgi:hypothetical protein